MLHRSTLLSNGIEQYFTRLRIKGLEDKLFIDDTVVKRENENGRKNQLDSRTFKIFSPTSSPVSWESVLISKFNSFSLLANVNVPPCLSGLCLNLSGVLAVSDLNAMPFL